MGAPEILERRRIVCLGDGVATTVAALARAMGHDVARDATPGADLVMVEPGTLASLVDRASPIWLISPERIRRSDRQGYHAVGVERIFDRDASVLEVAFAMADQLFDTGVERRRYAREFGGKKVELKDPADASFEGQLLGISSCGALLTLTDALDEGTMLRVRMCLDDRPFAFHGRVVFSAPRGERHEIGLEFALDHANVAPRLASLCGGVPPGESAPTPA